MNQKVENYFFSQEYMNISEHEGHKKHWVLHNINTKFI